MAPARASARIEVVPTDHMLDREHTRRISHAVVQRVRSEADHVASGGGRATFLKKLPDGRVVKVVTQGHLGITTYDQRHTPVVVILMPIPSPDGQTSLLMTAEYPAPAYGYPGLDLLGGLGQFTMPLERPRRGPRATGGSISFGPCLFESIQHAAQVCCLRESGLLLSVETFRDIEYIDDYIGAHDESGITSTPLRQGKSLASIVAAVPAESRLRQAVLTPELVQQYAHVGPHAKSNDNWHSLTTERLGTVVWVVDPLLAAMGEADASCLRDSCMDYVRYINEDATDTRRALPSFSRLDNCHRAWEELPRPVGGFAAAALLDIDSSLLESIDPTTGNDKLFLEATLTRHGDMIRARVADAPCGFNPEGLRAISCRFTGMEYSLRPATPRKAADAA